MEFDTASDCSGVSNPSDEIRSNASTLSGLSTYQEEFAELRHLVNPIKYPSSTFERCTTPKVSGSDLSYDDRISNLSRQLENSLKLNEKYKQDLYNLEKNTELKFYDKIDKLLKSNHRLKSELDNANSQIVRLIKNFSTKHNPSFVSQKNYIHLEQQYHELSLQNSTLQFSLTETRKQNEEYELQNKQLKIDLNELKIDFEAKKGCVKELKEKISQQHLEIQTLTKHNVVSSQTLSELSSEIGHLKKVQEWYREQLHICQRDKKGLSEEILKYKIDLSSQNETIQTLNLELAKCRNRCDVIQLEALKEKERLLKQLENSNFLPQIPAQSNSVKNDINYNNFEDSKDKSIINYYESSIQDLNDEIIKIKDYVQEQDSTIKRIVKENSELIARCITLQKNLQQNESSIEELENSRKFLNMELRLANEKVKKQSDELTLHKTELLNVNAELKVRKDEKQLVESTIKTVRERFFAFKSKYQKLEEELVLKNKQILQLESEKQKLFMDNNWNICELEKNKEKDTVINNLKIIITKCEKENAEQLADIKRLENELEEKNDVIKTLGDEKQAIINNSSIEIHKYEDVFTQYKVMVTNYEKEIDELRKHLSQSETCVTDLEDNLMLLKEELSRRDLDLNALTTKCTLLENKLHDLEKDGDVKPSEAAEYHIKKLINQNNFNLIETLQNFMEVCKIDNTNKNDDLKLKEIGDLLAMVKTIEKYLHNLDNKNADNRHQERKDVLEIINNKFETAMESKLFQLNDKLNMQHSKLDKCCRMLNNFTNFKEILNENERVKELSVLIQVKEREIKEKQRKYEINYRTLLRKVKEHMKGRNAAEKHNKYLQELYNSLSDENNTLKLMASSKDYEIDNIKKQLTRYISINDKLNETVSSLEERVIKSKTCDKCLDYAAAIKKLEMLEKYVGELEHEKAYIQTILKSKEEVICNLHQENKETLQMNSSLISENDKFRTKLASIESEKQNLENQISNLESEMKSKHDYIEELKNALKEENDHYLKNNNENIRLNAHCDHLNDKMEFLSKEIEILNSTLQSKSEELQQLEDKKSKLESYWVKKDESSQKTVVTLKNYLHEMQVELNSVNGEKYFLQRLCNDLKLALRTYVSHNKVLKEQLNVLSKEKQEFNSLPNILLDVPTSSKYDDTYINRLLQQNKAPTEDKPLIEIKGCLDNLRKEISVLQEEIVKKNIGR